MDNRKETAAAPISQIDYSDLAKAIAGVLSAAPMTAAEINAALGTDYTPLQISNAMQRISGASAGREVRMTVGASGRRREKEHAVYTLCGTGAVIQPSAGAVWKKKPPRQRRERKPLSRSTSRQRDGSGPKRLRSGPKRLRRCWEMNL